MPYEELPDRDGKANYIGFGVYGEDLAAYQLEMLKRNEIDGFLKLNIEDGRDGSRIYAEKNGKLQLSKVLGNKQFDLEDFLRLSNQVLKIADLGESYLLNKDCIILDEKFVLLDEYKTPSLFVLPVKETGKVFRETFLGFLKSLLLKTEINNSTDNIQDYKEIFHRLQMKDFEESNFGRFIEELQMSRKLFKENTVEEESVIDEFYKKSDKTKGIQKIELMMKIRSALVNSKIPEYSLLVGWCGFLALVLFMKLGIKEAAGGSALFLIGLFLAKRSFNNQQIHNEMTDEEWAENDMKLNNKEEEVLGGNNAPEINNEDVKEMKTFEKPYLYDCFSDTILIEEFKRPYIVPNEDVEGVASEEGTQEKYFVEKGIFIGRNKDLVNIYLPDHEVGKVHSEIWKEGSKIFIKDLNSKNGTWLNGIRLEEDEALELKDGDTIHFAIKKFTFRDI